MADLAASRMRESLVGASDGAATMSRFVDFAVPGRPGGVVIGSALLGRLDPDERTAAAPERNPGR